VRLLHRFATISYQSSERTTTIISLPMRLPSMLMLRQVHKQITTDPTPFPTHFIDPSDTACIDIIITIRHPALRSFCLSSCILTYLFISLTFSFLSFFAVIESVLTTTRVRQRVCLKMRALLQWNKGTSNMH